MNRQIIFFGFLLISHSLQSMEIIKKSNDKENFHESYVKPACLFLLSFNNSLKDEHNSTTLNDCYQSFKNLEKPSQYLIFQRLSDNIENPLFMLIIIPQDIFSYTMQLMVPQYEPKPKVHLGQTQLRKYDKNGYAQNTGYNPLATTQQNESTELVSTHQNQRKFFELNIHDALNALIDYNQRQTITVRDIVANPTFSKTSIPDANYFDIDIDDLSKNCTLDFNYFINTTVKQRKTINEIIEGHKKGLHDFNQRYKMTTNSIDLLLPNIDYIDNNQLLKHLQIGIVCEPPTKSDKIKDVLLLAFPLSIASGIIPHVIYNTINGKLQGMLGGIASYGVGFIIGNSIFPLFDSWSYSNIIAYKWFGSNNKTIEKRWSFATLSLFHYIIHAIAQQLLSVPNLPCQIVGYILHGLRIFIGIANLTDMKHHYQHYFNRHHHSLFADILDGLRLQQYNHPLELRNKDDQAYTLIDLLKAKQIKKPHLEL